MSTTTVRVKDNLMVELKARADQQGISLQALVDEILEREVAYGPRFGLRPLALPTGLLPIADEQFAEARDAKDIAMLVYGDRNGGLTTLACTINEVRSTILEVVIWQGGLPMNVPRDAIRAWEFIPKNDRNVLNRVMVSALLFQRYGSVLHAHVTISAQDRLARGLM